jgi:hypothetical protein
MRNALTKFWDGVLAPYLETAQPRMMLLAGRGGDGLTARLLEATGQAASVLHIADPDPDFDVAATRQLYGDRLTLHRAPARDVVGLLAVPDLLLIDADPNWYSVHAVLHAAAAQAARLSRHFPVTLVGNTGWPYGRRDGYGDPAAIPAGFRQPHERAGVRPDTTLLCGAGGLFSDQYHAVGEHEPRNGVMTAVEDFIAAQGGAVLAASLKLFCGVTVIYPSEAAGNAAVRNLCRAMAMGEAARDLAEAAEHERLAALADKQDMKQALAAARYRNEMLHDALRAAQEEAVASRSYQANADAPPTVETASRKPRLRRLIRLALWAAQLKLQDRLAAERRARDAVRAGNADIAALHATPLLDAVWYKKKYADVAASGADPAVHYYQSGAAEGRDPGPDFSTAHYLERNPDVAECGQNPLLHYVRHGAWEGRNPSMLFDSAYYLASQPDVAETGQNPLEHYVRSGRREGRRPLPPV